MSLSDRLKRLEGDLTSSPMRISAYHDLPFTIFRYDPVDEFECRKRLRLLAISLEQNHGRRVTFISLGQLLWRAIHETEGLDAIADDEERRGFEAAQQTVNTLLEDEDYLPLVDMVAGRAAELNPKSDIIFLVRVAAVAPEIYRSAVLLDKMHGRTMVPMVLFYPGTVEGQTDLRFMGMQSRAHHGTYNYRVKIYGDA